MQAATADKGRKLGEALAEQEWGRDVADLCDFSAAAMAAARVADDGKDLAAAVFLRKKHARLEGDLQARLADLADVQATGKALVDSGHFQVGPRACRRGAGVM